MTDTPNPIIEAIIAHWGERCADTMEGCPCCDAWAEYDRLTEQRTPQDLAALVAQATPGPWKVVIDDDGNPLSGRPSVHASDDLDCGIVHWDGFVQDYWRSARGDKEIHANARLIAMAPDLAHKVLEQQAEIARLNKLQDDQDAAWSERVAALTAALARLTADLRHVITERDQTFALMLDRAEKAEAALSESQAREAMLHRAITEASEPDFIWGAMDNVNDMDADITEFANAASRAIRASIPILAAAEKEKGNG